MKLVSCPTSVLALLMAVAMCHLNAAPTDTKSSKPEAESPVSDEEARKAAFERIETFGWTRNGKGPLGSVADIEIPKGFRFTQKSGTKNMMELFGNIPNDSQLGFISPENLEWFVIFSFDDVGYVKDTDKDQLDADKILEQIKSGQDEANDIRAEKGLKKLYLVGWAMKPRYNESTHNLEWAIKVRDESGSESVNYRTKLLGRKGVMNATLLVGPEEMNAFLPDYQKMLTGFSFRQGQTYAEYRQGDKVAQYALTGLITAGAGVALLKSGWLAKLGLIFVKLGKATYLVVVGALAALKRLFVRVFGKKTESQ